MTDTAITKPATPAQVPTPVDVRPANDRQQTSETGKVSPQQEAAEATEVSRQEVVEAVSNIADFVQNISRDLQFRVDDVTGGTVVTVTDSATEQVIRQIPSEEVVAISRYIAETQPDPVKGLLMNGES